ncbi:MAG: hypothetical protein FWH53_05470 [Leptospirales bacterium]|nr:hypothetical protein [Leptospirales bacterium]
MKKLAVFIFVSMLFFSACGGSDGGKDTKNVPPGPTFETFSFNNLNGNDIYLVKVNKSNVVVEAADTGGVSTFGVSALSMGLLNNRNEWLDMEEELPLMDYPPALEFNANPPPIDEEPPRRLQTASIPSAVGETRNFWVETVILGRLIWTEKQATLRATGTHGNIWVMNENYSPTSAKKLDNQITTEQAEALADKFDLIYPAATNILGFEYGGGPNGNGGIDGDPKIQILIYDIAIDASGYFWGKDLLQQFQLETHSRDAKTNLAEIFYLDAYVTNNYPDFIYSTMIHELQHLINYSVKWIKHEKSSATWYNEMLSIMAEDIIAPMIGVDLSNSDHPVMDMRRFLIWYDQVGITKWDSSSNSYAKGFAFGAYLLRNYGGAELLKSILANDTTNIESISSALNEISPGMNFEKAFARFGEAMIYSGLQKPEGVMTFDKTVTSAINGFTYTAYGFDIWNDFDVKGPVIFNLRAMEMEPHSISIHSANEWKNISGDFSITLEQPTNENIELYLLKR